MKPYARIAKRCGAAAASVASARFARPGTQTTVSLRKAFNDASTTASGVIHTNDGSEEVSMPARR